MRRPLLMTAGIVLFAAAALAAADIPTRYAGSFPSDGVRKNITGTFTGTRLTLKWEVPRGARTGSFSCTKISSTQTRCPGTARGVGGGDSDPLTVTVTWSGGRPVATAFAKG